MINENQNENVMSFAELLDDYDYVQPKRGQILQGEILKVDDIILVDVGTNRDAIVPHEEVQQLGEEMLHGLVGDEIPVMVTHLPSWGSDELIVSIERGLEQKDWKRAAVLMEDDESLDLKVTGHNKGGILVEFGRLSGFVPNSRIPQLRRYLSDNQALARQKQKMVDEMITVKIVEVDRQKKRFILAADAALEEQRQEMLENLTEETVINGTVVHIVPYGAFVDIGGVNGLLHISNISWKNVSHPSDELSVGDEFEVMIESVDVEKERVSLNRKILLPQPWDHFAKEYEMNDLVSGTVADVVDFGAFIQLPHEQTGLLHISEISDDFVESTANVLQPGDEVLTRIISLDPSDQKIGLSLRRVTQSEEILWMQNKDEAFSPQEEEAEATELEVEATELEVEAPEEEVEATELEVETTELEVADEVEAEEEAEMVIAE
mgnify:CR=1 FL=1